MELTQREKKYQFLNSILNENKISLSTIYEYMEEHEDNISEMTHIFDSDESELIRKRLVLLSLISRNQTQKNLDYYRDLKKYNQEPIDSDINSKIELLTALMFNARFFKRACNWCGLIQNEVNRVKPEMAHENTRNTKPEYKYHTIVKYKQFSSPIMADAAAGEGYEEYFHENDIAHDGISGTLFFKGDDQKRVYLEFDFDEIQDKIPFEIEFRFRTINDHNQEDEYILVADIPVGTEETGFDGLRSGELENVSYDDGIKANSTIYLRLPTSS